MISTGTGFKILSRDSIDERFILSKDQMLNINEAVQPENYFCVCTDDSMLYVYNVNNPVDAETGKFRKVSSNESVDPSIFQKINDDTLITEDKTIVGAINELKSGLDGIKVPSTSGGSSNETISITLTGYTAPSYENIYEFEEVGNEYMTASDNKTFDKTANEFLSEWYDIYTGLHSDGMLVTKSLIGYDQTNKYPVYEYDFKPKNYNRTILITSGLHSYELSAIYGIAHLFKDLMTTPYKHVGFKYIRENVRIKIIPILNPWGFNQSPKVYANSNGVNPNRNFNFNGSWDVYPNKPYDEWNYKGTAPFSEQETKNIANWLYYNKEIADFWIDFHTGYDDTLHDIWCLYQSYSPLSSKIESAREKLVNRIKSKYGVTTVNDYAQIDYVNSIKIEWSEQAVGIPMMVVEQSPLNPKWKTGNYNNNGGAIREYATQAYVFLQELLSCDTVTYNLIDYLYTLRDDIFNNSCKQIPFYSSSSYKAFSNAGSTSSGNGGEDKTKTLKCTRTTIAVSDGAETPSTTRLSTDYIPIKNTTGKMTINCSNNCYYTVRLYDINTSYIGIITATDFPNGDGWAGGKTTLTSNSISSDIAYVRLLFKSPVSATTTIDSISGTVQINDGQLYSLTM